jgi:hypothetical protein
MEGKGEERTREQTGQDSLPSVYTDKYILLPWPGAQKKEGDQAKQVSRVESHTAIDGTASRGR